MMGFQSLYNECRFRLVWLNPGWLIRLLNWKKRNYVDLLSLPGIPEDAEVVSVSAEWTPARIGVLLYHPSFPILPPGQLPAFEPLQFDLVRCRVNTPGGTNLPVLVVDAPAGAIDLSNLSPAPWVADCRPAVPGGLAAEGYGVLRGPRPTHGSIEMKAADAAFIALARNAFDVQMRRGWFPRKSGDGWFVDLWQFHAIVPRMWGHLGTSPDSFTALVEADRWYKENVEVQP